jgi:titin
VIAGNDASIFSRGISLTGEVDLPITITGNFIGLTPALVLDLGNGNAGVQATDLRPSGTNPTNVSLLLGPGNVIGYNGSDTDPADGVLITGTGSGAYVFTNAVGVAEAGGGFIDLGNSGNGIVVTTPDNFIGVDDLGVVGGNFVGANGGNGIELRGLDTTGNVVVGNFVGDPDPDDAFSMGNDGNGIHLAFAPDNRIGGPRPTRSAATAATASGSRPTRRATSSSATRSTRTVCSASTWTSS